MKLDWGLAIKHWGKRAALLLFCLLFSVSGALVAQLAVRPEVVVAMPEVFDDHTRFAQCPELLAVEAFVAKAVVDASGARKPAAGSPQGSVSVTPRTVEV